MTGSTSDMMSASTVRRDSRTQRATITRASRVNEAGRSASSDMDDLLGRGVVSGQGEEDVVEGGGVHVEPGDRAARRVDPVERGADVGRGAVGFKTHQQPRRVTVHDLVA